LLVGVQFHHSLLYPPPQRGGGLRWGCSTPSLWEGVEKGRGGENIVNTTW